jgi:DNA-binding SARP family transcriptional activator
MADSTFDVRILQQSVLEARFGPHYHGHDNTDADRVTLITLSYHIELRTLGRFEIYQDGVQLTFCGKVQKKPLELLKALISHGARKVSVVMLAGELWPDADGASALNSFTAALHRLRQLLGSERVILKQDDEISIDRELVWVDAWAFEELLIAARQPLKQGDEVRALEIIREAIALYQGSFLPCEPEKSWAFTYREHLRGRFTHAAGKVCRYLEAQGETHEAIDCYRDGLKIDHLSEEFYQQLMLCYLQAGLHAEAAVVWECCRKNLALHLAIAPSPKTMEIYRMISR